MSENRYKKFDTYGETVYLVRLATDARTFPRDNKVGEDGANEDVVLTFCDNSRIENTEELWVDARVHSYHNELAKKMRKGDVVQIKGKLRFKKNHDGSWRGKIYDARFATFANFERGMTPGDEAATPTFE